MDWPKPGLPFMIGVVVKYINYAARNLYFCIYTDIIPVLRMSPAPGEQDMFVNLDEREGISDLYDIGHTHSGD